MLMVKAELANTGRLFRVKARNAARQLHWILITFSLLPLFSLVSAVAAVLRDNGMGLMYHKMADHSISAQIVLIFACVVLMLLYRQENTLYSMYPQTNSSRFISSQLWIHTLITITGALLLAFYLFHNAVMRVLALFHDLRFVLDFDAGFIVLGFFTFLAYMFLVAALFGLIGAALRKWGVYAAVTLLSLLSVAIRNTQWVVEEGLAFLIEERTPLWFFLKAAALWLVLTVLSLLVNYHTLYYKSGKRLSIAAYASLAAIVLVIALLLPLILWGDAGFGGATSVPSSGMEITALESREDPYKTIRIDISRLPKGTSIAVAGERLLMVDSGESYSINPWDITLCVIGHERLVNPAGGTLVLRYLQASYKVDGYDLADLAKPQFFARLDGTTLHIDYRYTPVKVLLLPIWSWARQFDYGAEKNLLTQSAWGSSRGGHAADLYISVEE